MKRLMIGALCCLLLLGCAAQSAETAPTTAPVAQEPTLPPVQLLLYLPNDSADGFLTREATLPELDGQRVFELLIAAGVLEPDVRVKFLTMEGDRLTLDVNGALPDQLMTCGSAGEYMLMGSVVNTLLTAYGAQSLTITADGKIIESGHVIYDMPLTFFA